MMLIIGACSTRKVLADVRRVLPANAGVAPMGAADVIAVSAIAAGSYCLLRRSRVCATAHLHFDRILTRSPLAVTPVLGSVKE